MSFILDALKKSESDRQRADAPALYEMKMAPARPRVATWLIVLAALLLINVVVLAIVLWRGNRAATPQLEATPAATPAATPQSVTAAPQANPIAASPPAPVTSAPPPAASLAPSAQAPDTAATSTATPSEDDVPAVEPARTNPASVAPNEVPTYEQASAAPGANLPELKLDLHAYASNPADRFVFLNGVNLKEGQSSPQGVRVEAITPDGAVLSWRGTRFLLHSQ